MPPLARDEERGRRFWRSLDELTDSDEFRRFAEREFPAWADEALAAPSRRGFLKLMGASVALAGMTGCRYPQQEIVPFAHRPDGRIPGKPLRYATAMELHGAATGLLVTSYDGRPIKIEGNPDHPQSLGSTLPWHQAALLELYDPERSDHPVHGGAAASWEDFEAFARAQFGARRGRAGSGIAVLSGAS